jgi:hypothetical protein
MLRCVLATFEQKISEVKLDPKLGFTGPGTWLLSLLSEMNITAASKIEFLDVMDGTMKIEKLKLM